MSDDSSFEHIDTERLSGETNYTPWAVVTKDLLSELELWDIVSGAIPKPRTYAATAAGTIATPPTSRQTTTAGRIIRPSALTESQWLKKDAKVPVIFVSLAYRLSTAEINS